MVGVVTCGVVTVGEVVWGVLTVGVVVVGRCTLGVTGRGPCVAGGVACGVEAGCALRTTTAPTNESGMKAFMAGDKPKLPKGLELFPQPAA